MARIVKLGVAGLGNAGRAVIRDLPAAPGVALAAVADLRAEALEPFRRDPAVETFDDVEAMCRSGNIDAVWVATPNQFHAANAAAAAAAGKHVVCEKPMALDLEECDRMIAAAAAGKVRLLMHSKAGDPPVIKMREIIAGGRLGRPIQISSWNYKGWLNLPRLPAELDTSRGGGVVYRQGAHQVDIVRALGGGPVKSVRASAGRHHPGADTEGNYSAFLEFADGAPATLVFNGHGRFDMTEITWSIGEGGYASRTTAEKSALKNRAGAAARREGEPRSDERREGPRRQPFFGLTLVSCEKGDIRQSPDGLYIYTDDGREEIACPPFLDRAGELVRLYEAVVEDRPVLADGKWGKATLEIVLAILESSRTRREVELKYQF
ncbi:MAG TPA: Gfo/Idh/MocA family oxidoreductase [Candidatus Binatia bacterium]